MIRSLHTGVTGAEAQQNMIDTISNNITNANTNAFKKSRVQFQDLLYQNIRAPGLVTTNDTIAPSGIQIGNGAHLASVEKIFQEGAIRITNIETDLNIRGKGFFRVQMPDGNTAYTRSGAFRRNNEGRLVNAEGLALVPEIIVPANTTSLRIALDGTVSAVVSGEAEPRRLGVIEIANFINPAGLSALGRNLYGTTPASGDAIITIAGDNGTGNIGQGELESSNVNIVEEMVNMIMAQRAYELNTKVIKTGDEMLSSTNQMKA